MVSFSDEYKHVDSTDSIIALDSFLNDINRLEDRVANLSREVSLSIASRRQAPVSPL